MSLAGPGLVLDYWGPTTLEVPMWAPPDPMPDFETLADIAPLECTSNGTRHVHQSELLIDHGDGLLGSTWVFDGHSLTEDIESVLAVHMRDETGSLRLTLHTAVRPDSDVVRRWSTIHNVSADRAVTLRRAWSGGWSVNAPHGARLSYLAGAWGREFDNLQVPLRYGTFSIGSRMGVTGHLFSPHMVFEPFDVRGEVSEGTAAIGVALAWSGSWEMVAEAHANARAWRVSAGVQSEALAIVLNPGESFQTPETLGVYSAAGAEGVRRAWHHYQRKVLARSVTPYHQPVVYNSWFATRFDVRSDHQRELARVAADLGAEVFVVDDGWFRGRDSERRGLGDWTPDLDRMPEGLTPLIEAVQKTGMRFGLWIEPEGVNPDSDLFREHPDWVYRACDRPLVSLRKQYVLDFGRPEVVEWIQETLRDLLTSYQISYLKWDMNRPVTDGGRPGDARSARWAIDHTQGYYRVLQMLRDEFPHVTIEGCAGGGGRVDPAVLALTDVVWPSDETGPRDRLMIQDGFLRAYPQHVMSSWVTDLLGTRDRAQTSLGFRFVTSMAGALGIGSDLLSWDHEKVKHGRDLVELYKSIRQIVHNSQVHTHGDPGMRGYTQEFLGEDGTIVLLTWAAGRDRPADAGRFTEWLLPARLFPKTVTADRRYRVRSTGEIFTGAVLRSDGLPIPWLVAPDADVLILDPLDERPT
ncbi:alpha-galactosidase [Kribbella aluminosa]|uniref:Alpha-galactosidase n=1 Tax=Kribbella aluminosa TaxID=416017 RepID=A0ABS4UWP8_9ACTN|nr:alpha-galactosidase [Kribbella aluminosa]MBP2356056.1 alpha-galactosidase [Kribbella aluminosa]